MNVFDYVKSISENKQNLINEETFEKDYSPYIVNKAFSFTKDTVLLANELNIKPNIPKKSQYLFLLNTIRPMKRYSKWVKRSEDDYAMIQKVRKLYNTNSRNARNIISLLSPDQIKKIKENTKDESDDRIISRGNFKTE